MLEAMSTGCLIVASDTQPVTEVIENRENGLLANFFNTKEIADRVEEALDNIDKMQTVRQNARQTIIDNFNLANLLPQHLHWISHSDRML
jgi:glycosyltransferase involved in cell wall biosynthesis